MESKRMPLTMRLAAVHGDADQAATQLNNMARVFHLDIERMLVDESPVPKRRRVRLSLPRPELSSSPGVAAAPAPTA